MTRISFYILQDSISQGRELFACRLAEKAYTTGLQTYIHTAGQPQSSVLDRLLWTFRQHSFVPHAVENNNPDPEVPVLIGHTRTFDDTRHTPQRTMLINMAEDIPVFFSSFERVAEIVDPQPEHKAQGRARYRFYRERGYTLENHTI